MERGRRRAAGVPSWAAAAGWQRRRGARRPTRGRRPELATPRIPIDVVVGWMQHGVVAAPGMAADRLCGLPRGAPAHRASTDLDDSGAKRHAAMGGGGGAAQRGAGCVNSSERTGDQKTEQRLAQNREAAWKSRMRKRAYVKQLESSRSKLVHLEQELQR